MSFARHRTTTAQTVAKKEEAPKTEPPKIDPPEIDFSIKAEEKEILFFDEEEIEVVKPPVKQKPTGGEPIPEKELPEKKKLTQKEFYARKKKENREKKKAYDLDRGFNNCGVVGDTLEVKDFRAIVKKSGKQINTVLTSILHDWNTANYNL
jgi:hypothetical protein